MLRVKHNMSIHNNDVSWQRLEKELVWNEMRVLFGEELFNHLSMYTPLSGALKLFHWMPLFEVPQMMVIIMMLHIQSLI